MGLKCNSLGLSSSTRRTNEPSRNESLVNGTIIATYTLVFQPVNQNWRSLLDEIRLHGSTKKTKVQLPMVFHSIEQRYLQQRSWGRTLFIGLFHVPASVSVSGSQVMLQNSDTKTFPLVCVWLLERAVVKWHRQWTEVRKLSVSFRLLFHKSLAND